MLVSQLSLRALMVDQAAVKLALYCLACWHTKFKISS